MSYLVGIEQGSPLFSIQSHKAEPIIDLVLYMWEFLPQTPIYMGEKS